MRAFILPLLATAALGACDAATPPTITVADITAAELEQTRISALGVATTDQLPVASATYVGHLGGDVSVDGESDYAILGDVNVVASFSGTSLLTGTVDNINLIEDGTPSQLLGGSLAITGNNAANVFAATASGELDAVGEDLPFRGTAQVQLSLAGDYRVDPVASGTPTSLVGTWAGGTTSGDFIVVGTGDVYATQE